MINIVFIYYFSFEQINKFFSDDTLIRPVVNVETRLFQEFIGYLVVMKSLCLVHYLHMLKS